MNVIKQKIKIFKFTDKFIDMVLLLISARVSIIIQRLYHDMSWGGLSDESFNFLAMPIIFITWLILFNLIEKKALYRQTSYKKILLNIILITFIGVTTTISIDFLLKTILFQRSTIVLIGAISFLVLLLKRWIVKAYLSYIREEGLDTKNILIIGSKKRASYLVDEINNHKEYGFIIRKIIDPDSDREGILISEFSVSGKFSDLYTFVMDLNIDEVFIAMPLDQISNIQECFEFFHSLGVNYHVMINTRISNINYETLRLEPVLEDYYGLPMVSFNSLNANLYSLYIKNIWEKLFATLLIIFTTPIILLFGLLVRFTSRGPIFFRQERVGLHGRSFFQYKLRSMVVNAEALKADLAHLNEQSGPVFKIKADPRLTKVGKFIRKFSIDELPQLFNVIMGDMNLIGPRPPVPQEVKQYTTKQMRRLSMKPGITGLWQVSGRNELKEFEDWVKLDLEYIDNWNLVLDFKIALKTVFVVISGSGR
jgi:exopolysaccharide biosynthesis polyprenyl glycosylphosphotransferase|tara:strand:- start:1369 stop:2811 length:1443 start_codon:yes stop_codon:yes gene_type:complete